MTENWAEEDTDVVAELEPSVEPDVHVNAGDLIEEPVDEVGPVY